jgi:hypothetical protein
MTSPAFRKCVFRAFLILQLTTLYSGHIAKLSLTLEVIRFSIISGKWKVLERIPGFTIPEIGTHGVQVISRRD